MAFVVGDTEVAPWWHSVHPFGSPDATCRCLRRRVWVLTVGAEVASLEVHGAFTGSLQPESGLGWFCGRRGTPGHGGSGERLAWIDLGVRPVPDVSMGQHWWPSRAGAAQQ